LGFPEQQVRKLLTAAGFADIRIQGLPVDPEAKGPALFVAAASKAEPADLEVRATKTY
jgi:hypothetical protein